MGERTVREPGMDVDTRLCLTCRTSKDLLASPGKSAQCQEAAWTGGEYGGECIHVHVWLRPFVAHLKSSNVTNWLLLLYGRSVIISLRPHGLQPARLLCPRDSPGKNTGVSCHFLLLRSSPPRDRTQVSCTGMQVLYHGAPQGVCLKRRTQENHFPEHKRTLARTLNSSKGAQGGKTVVGDRKETTPRICFSAFL